jgi:hypothetical protein
LLQKFFFDGTIKIVPLDGVGSNEIIERKPLFYPLTNQKMTEGLHIHDKYVHIHRFFLGAIKIVPLDGVRWSKI